MHFASHHAKPHTLLGIAAVATILGGGVLIGLGEQSDVPAIFERLGFGGAGEAGAAREVGASEEGAGIVQTMKGRVIEGIGGDCGNCGVIEAVGVLQAPSLAVAAPVLAGSRNGGRTVLGVLGAVGGARSAHGGEREGDSGPSYRLRVRMEDGSFRTMYLSAPPTVTVGDKVRLLNGVVVAQG